MKIQLNEIKRMQQLAGLLKEEQDIDYFSPDRTRGGYEYAQYWDDANNELELGFDEDKDLLDMANNADEQWQRAFANQVIKDAKTKIDSFFGSARQEYQLFKNIVKKAYEDNNPF
jgi:hypothetical protein